MEIKKKLSFATIANLIHAINGNPQNPELPGLINWSENSGQGKKKYLKIKHSNDLRLNLSYLKIPLESVNALFKEHSEKITAIREEAKPIIEKYNEFRSEDNIMPKAKQDEMEKELEPFSAQINEANDRMNKEMEAEDEVNLRVFPQGELDEYDLPQANYIMLSPIIEGFVEL